MFYLWVFFGCPASPGPVFEGFSQGVDVGLGSAQGSGVMNDKIGLGNGLICGTVGLNVGLSSTH